MLFPLIVALALHAQVVTAPPNTPPPFDPRPAIENMMHALDESAPDHTRFTYHKRERTITQLQNGRPVYDETHTYEVTWINDRPYWRLIAVDDQPLDTKQQQKETKLYDKALAKNKDLGQKQRFAMTNITAVKQDADPEMLFGPMYTFTETASQTITKGVTEYLIEATLVPGAKPKSHCRYQYKFWITRPDNFVRSYTAEAPGSKSFSCSNAKDIASFTVVDGVLKPSRITTRFFPDELNGNVAVDDIIFSQYQWFSTDGETGKATVHRSETQPNASSPAHQASPPR